MNPVLILATEYVRAGLSIIPIRADGSKAPCCKWGEYRERIATEAELRDWYRWKRGIAIVCGAVSDNVELLEFDVPAYFRAWIELVDESCPGLFERLTVIETPRGGWHLPYRCDVIEGNQKLAQVILDDGELKTAIETRGEGGYFLAPGSPAACHPSGRLYTVRAGSLCDLTTITSDEREAMFAAARTFNEYTPAPITHHSSLITHHSGFTPGNDFNARADWYSLLIAHGWASCGAQGEASYWKRPGKDDRGWSARLNRGGDDRLYVYTSNASPLEAHRSYSKFQFVALVDFDGDFRAATAALRAQGYGVKRLSFCEARPETPAMRAAIATPPPAMIAARPAEKPLMVSAVPMTKPEMVEARG